VARDFRLRPHTPPEEGRWQSANADERGGVAGQDHLGGLQDIGALAEFRPLQHQLLIDEDFQLRLCLAELGRRAKISSATVGASGRGTAEKEEAW